MQELSGHRNRDEGCAWAEQNQLPGTKTDGATVGTKCLTYQGQRPMLSFWTRTIAQKDNWWLYCTLCYVLGMIHLDWIWNMFYSRVCLSYPQASASITSLGLNIWAADPDLTNITMDQGTHSTAREAQQWAHGYWMRQSYHTSHDPEAG